MQLHADKCSSPMDRRKRIQSVHRNDLADFLQQRVSLAGSETRVGVGDRNQSRPMPPMLGNGETVDLLKLFVHVKRRGGYDAISRNGFWEEVGEDQGLTCSGLGSAIKLIYYKYFLSSRREPMKVSTAVDSEGEAVYGNLGLNEDYLMCFASNNSKERKTDGEESEEGSTDGANLCNGKKDWRLEEEVEVIEIISSDDERASVDMVVSNPGNVEKVPTSSANVERFSREKIDKEGIPVVDLSATKDEGSSRKRKRERGPTFSKMFDWLAGAAKDRANPAIETLSDDERASVDMIISNPDNVAKVPRSSVNVERFSRAKIDNEGIPVMDLSATKDKGSSRKTKRERDPTFSKMLDWLAGAAKDPANPAIGTLPESSKWKSYGGEHCWKQVLLMRAALFRKRPEDASPEQFPWQKRPKVHPSMFDEAVESAGKVRSSPRLQLASSLETNNHISSLSSFNLRKRIPIGPFFQAELPEWTGVMTESDSKWLGTRIWPPEEESLKFVLEDDLTQKKTRNSCTRDFPGSLEGIRSHLSRRRLKLKGELGSAFYSWKFDKMGEDAANSWTKKDEKKFEVVVKENPLSQGKCFWYELSKTLPTRSRQELVSYYFNVFLLRRRAHQNRYIPSNIDSDDDETEFIAKSSSLIFSPGKKKNVD